MNEKQAKEILALLGQLMATQAEILRRMDTLVTDFNEFGDRFDEAVTQLEDVRRLDLISDYN